MGNRCDMARRFCMLDQGKLDEICTLYSIGPEFQPTLPSSDQAVTDRPSGFVALYTRFFEFSNLWFPLSVFYVNVLEYYGLDLSQLASLVRDPKGSIDAINLPGSSFNPRYFELLESNRTWVHPFVEEVLVLAGDVTKEADMIENEEERVSGSCERAADKKKGTFWTFNPVE
ncbi:hypothetical protein L1987_23661 [Smallanthus sonchifolius]|uniref:Uncharacterized protein n=1 Tax=Smallanthus sonchifolius TaxID=185202 RepID=A0ACB9II27_9ASTR|nr:hypothetical protein L1987_23661 [Smallanthus sonchifolius]